VADMSKDVQHRKLHIGINLSGKKNKIIAIVAFVKEWKKILKKHKKLFA
jgi:hypothetical protein